MSLILIIIPKWQKICTQTRIGQNLGEIYFNIDWGLCVFSLKKIANLPQYEAEHEFLKYKINIQRVQIMEATDKHRMNFLKIFFNSIMKLWKKFEKFNLRIELF